jgi:hypothetical protein
LKGVFFLGECRWFQVCPLKRFWEQGRLDGKWIENYCKGLFEKCKRYQAVEKGVWHEDCMLPDGKLEGELLK